MNTVDTMAEPVLTSPTSNEASRLQNIDIFRGLAIIDVVGHHTIGICLRDSAAYPVLHRFFAFISVAIHFSVPCFLFMSALVLTRSALSKPFDIRRYYRNRVKKVLIPYLIWTVIFVILRVVTKDIGWQRLLQPSDWFYWLRYGKAYFHLYFLILALQFYVILPVLLPIWRLKPPFWAVIMSSACLQLAVYFLNLEVLHLRYNGSSALWYIPSLMLGMYFGSRSESFETFFQNYKAILCFGFPVAFCLYIAPAFHQVLKEPVNSMEFELVNWLFTSVSAILLFALSNVLAVKFVAELWLLKSLGRASLQIYLIHPIFLSLFQLIFPPHTVAEIFIFGVVYFVFALLVSFKLADSISGTKYSVVLFGR